MPAGNTIWASPICRFRIPEDDSGNSSKMKEVAESLTTRSGGPILSVGGRTRTKRRHRDAATRAAVE